MLHDVPPFEFVNFQEKGAIQVRYSGQLQYDSQLGWVHVAHREHESFEPNWLGVRTYAISRTLTHGIRSNGRSDHRKVRENHLLAVGSSWTAGAGVKDGETWPAQLEAFIGSPVENAAVGGYAMDQLLLRAEQLLPILRPKILLVGTLGTNIDWVGYSYMTRHKPFFTVEDGELVLQNSPVPLGTIGTGRDASILRYSYITDRIMATIDSNAWYLGSREIQVRAPNNSLHVNCLLLQRVKRQTERMGTRMILVLQHPGGDIIKYGQSPPKVALVKECAESMGIQVVDTFGGLKAAYARDPEALWEFYKKEDSAYGHWSKGGHRFVARAIAAVLEDPPPSRQAADYRSRDFGIPDTSAVPGDGHNLIPMSHGLHMSPGGNNSVAVDWVPDTFRQMRVFELKVVDTETLGAQHYIAQTITSIEPGPYTLSAYVKAGQNTQLRVQMLDEVHGGVIADYAPLQGTTALHPLSKWADGAFTPAGSGWNRLTVSAEFEGSSLTWYVQLKDEYGGTAFPGEGQSILIAGLMIERGTSASDYIAPPVVPGNGHNLIPMSHGLHVSPGGNNSVAVDWVPDTFRQMRVFEFKVVDTETAAEHYIAQTITSIEPGPYTLSAYVKTGQNTQLRVQMRDEVHGGVIADYAPLQGTTTLYPLSKWADGAFTPVGSGWNRLTASAEFEGSSLTWYVQLKDEYGGTASSGEGQSILIAGLMIERGTSASDYIVPPVVSH